MDLILGSKWFSKFYDEEFLITFGGEVSYAKNKEIYSHCPIRFFAFMLEELFAIRCSLIGAIDFLPENKEILKIGDFDKFIEWNMKNIDSKISNQLKDITSKAVMSLGSYESTKISLNYYTKDSGILSIPAILSNKLMAIGRIPLTIQSHFNMAVNDVSG